LRYDERAPIRRLLLLLICSLGDKAWCLCVIYRASYRTVKLKFRSLWVYMRISWLHNSIYQLPVQGKDIQSTSLAEMFLPIYMFTSPGLWFWLMYHSMLYDDIPCKRVSKIQSRAVSFWS
jgi:hypothetical protein